MLPRKTTILIIVLAVVTLLLVYLAIQSEQPTTTPETTKAPEQQDTMTAEKTAVVSFQPQTVTVSNTIVGTSSATTVDIIVNTGGTEITGVQLELEYDPAAISNVVITPPLSNEADSLFGPSYNVLFNEVDEELGRISYAITIPQSRASSSGSGKVGTISFTKAAAALPSTSHITFLDKTTVTTEEPTVNALKTTTPLTIIVSGTSAPIGTDSATPL